MLSGIVIRFVLFQIVTNLVHYAILEPARPPDV